MYLIHKTQLMTTTERHTPRHTTSWSRMILRLHRKRLQTDVAALTLT